MTHFSLHVNTLLLPRHNYLTCFEAVDSKYLKRRNYKHCTENLL
uniref:Alternative protein SESTD1 n=1 Tax=Homo sapiens TaxID=9606 RepID=L8EBH0_HUMAN|nr:alternative protein SESTD1 [Homo sapiens]